MAIGTDELIGKIKELSDEEKLRLVDVILTDLNKRDAKMDRVWADEARKRLLQHLVGPKTQELVDRIIGGENLAFQVRDKDGIGCVLDDNIRIERAMRPGTVSRDGGGGRSG